MAHSSSPAVFAEGLVKTYGATRALQGVDLSIEQGAILGVLGPNGAGKSTAVRILSTLTKPDAGRAMVAGFDVVQHPEEVRRRIGLTGQYASVDELLNGRENLIMIARLYHLSRGDAKRRADELLERFRLTDDATKLVKNYSGGMRRRLDLAAGLIISPPVLFLDEPTTGLDPRGRLDMWALIAEQAARGATLLLTTQYLEEADQLANDIIVIDHGRVIARGTANELKARTGGARLETRIAAGADLSAAARILASFASGSPSIDTVERLVVIPIVESSGLITRISAALDAEGIAIDNVELTRPTLDDVFLQITGHAAEDAGVNDPAEQAVPARLSAKQEAA
jgi:ABC-2 type transport system ATP-binding protein